MSLESIKLSNGADPAPMGSSRTGILPSALYAIGDTPVIRLNKIPEEEGLKCELLVKCEYFNAGGSVKDRIGRRMIEDAERSGRIKPGDVLIEPTSGNTGIGLALAAALKGYRMIITLPEKMSQEKVDVLKALGAEIIRTPTEAAFDAPESHIGVAKKLNSEIPNSHILDQYANEGNPLAHYDGTALEIYQQCGGKLDVIVMTAGTGGTMSGTARRLKELIPNIKVVAVDPKGSILAVPDSLNDEHRLQGYAVEGIGYDFIPDVLDRSLVDEWLKTDDKESFLMARRLIKEEGLLCGGSSGAAVAAAVRYARSLPEGTRVLAVLPDSVRNYMTKFLNDDWMWRNNFVDPERGFGVGEKRTEWWASRTVSDLNIQAPITISADTTAQQAVELMTQNGIDQLPVVDASSTILGVCTEGNLTAKLTSGRIHAGDSIMPAVFKQFRRISVNTSLAEVARIFDSEPFCVVVQTQKLFSPSKDSSGGTVVEKSVVVGVLTRIDLLRFITKN